MWGYKISHNKTKGETVMHLLEIKCEDDHSTIDYMLKKDMMNDYIYNNTFITFVFKDNYGSSSIITFKAYLHRLLWETVFMKNSKISTHEVVNNDEIIYYIRCNLSEVLQFLETTVPPLLKKGHKVIELMDDLKSVMETCETLLTDEHTMKTNYSYFYNIMRIKRFDWQSSYPVQRAVTISNYLNGMNNDKAKGLTRVISDLMVGNTGIIDVSKSVVVTFTFNDKDLIEFMQLTQDEMINQNAFVTDVTLIGETTSVTYVLNMGKVYVELYGYIRDTYELLTNG